MNRGFSGGRVPGLSFHCGKGDSRQCLKSLNKNETDIQTSWDTVDHCFARTWAHKVKSRFGRGNRRLRSLDQSGQPHRISPTVPQGTNLESSLFYSRHIAAMFSSVHVHQDEFFSYLLNLSDQCEPDIKPSSNTLRYLLDHESCHEFLGHTFHGMGIIFIVSVLQAVLGNSPPGNCDCVSSRFTGWSIPLTRSDSRFSTPYLGYTRKLRAYNVISPFTELITTLIYRSICFAHIYIYIPAFRSSWIWVLQRSFDWTLKVIPQWIGNKDV